MIGQVLAVGWLLGLAVFPLAIVLVVRLGLDLVLRETETSVEPDAEEW